MLANRLCLRAVARPSLTLRCTGSNQIRFPPTYRASQHSQRVFTTSRWRRKDDARARTIEKEPEIKQPAEESVKPESLKAQKPAEPATKNDPLLAEQAVTNKEQRTADWAIIKDMAHYIWPKDDFGTRFRVGLSVGLLVGAKVGFCIDSTIRTLLIVYIGLECASPFLLQEYN